MKSDAQQISGGKSPYLSQYRDDISAKQKLIRQRLVTTGTTIQPNSSSENAASLKKTTTYTTTYDYKVPTTREQDRGDIPTIDGEDATSEQDSYTPSQRRHQSKYNYFDNEAEASLQFFKKNLLPKNETANRLSTTSTANKSLFEKRPTPLNPGYQFDSSTTSSRKIRDENIESNETQPMARLSVLDSMDTRGLSSASYNRYQIGSGKPVPFKQTLLNEKTTPKVVERTSFIETSTPKRAVPNANTYQYRQTFSASKVSNEKPTNQQVAQLKSTSDERYKISSNNNNNNNYNTRPKSYEKSSQPSSPLDNRQDFVKSHSHYRQQADNKSAHSTEGRRTPDTPSYTGSFSRKPLYNSLLRAHDSIRLKVNRPKVRPKSTNLEVKDTEVDTIPLANINSNDNSNERAVDVKRSSSRKSKNKAKDKSKEGKKDASTEKLPVRNFSEVRVVKIVRNENERSLGVTVRAEDGNIVVARIMASSLADKQGALQVGDIILSVDNREVYTPEQLQEQLRKSINEDVVLMKIVPSFREELPSLCIYLRALFSYDANEDSLLPCKEVGVSFNQGDILEVVNQEDPNWWQARRVESENLQTGLIPSQELEERRRAFVIPDYDLATRTSICGTKVSRKSKKKEIYNVGQNCDFDKAELQLYEEVCRTPAFERRTLVLIGSNGVGKQALKARLVSIDPERFGTPLPHTSRLPREGEEDGVHYHFVTRERMEEDIIDGRYLEYGEYDGALYGTKLDSIREIIGSGRVCVLDCSATCLKILKTSDYLPFVAFIAAPTIDQMRYMQDYARGTTRNYATFDGALSRQSRRAKTLQDFAFDFFEDEELQLAVEESARLFRVYANYFDIVLVNNNFERTFEQLREAIDALSMAPQWIPISWIYGN